MIRHVQAHDFAALRTAIDLAKEAENEGCLPIAAVVTLDGKIISVGKHGAANEHADQTLHAELEALRNIPNELRPRVNEMTLYTTCEPCIMCTAAIALSGLARVVFGSADSEVGGSHLLDSFATRFIPRLKQVIWSGPLLPRECGKLLEQVQTKLGLNIVPMGLDQPTTTPRHSSASSKGNVFGANKRITAEGKNRPVVTLGGTTEARAKTGAA